MYKLWLGHGITTIRDPSAGNGLAWTLDHKKKSQENKITAPRILAYTAFGQGAKEPITTPEQAREWVRQNAKNGADGIKFFGAEPEIFKAALDENKKLGLRSACHHAQLEVARMNVLATAKAGLTTMEHWYGLARGHVRRQDDPELPRRLQLQQRAEPLRRGRKTLATGRQARLRKLESGDGRTHCPGFHH